jgi:cell division protein ZapA (FtsZ GTPase activity inhibitor)
MEKEQGDENQKNPPNGNNNGNPPIGNATAGASNDHVNVSGTHSIHHEPLNIFIENKQPQDINAASANLISALSNRIAIKANRISIGNFLLSVAIFIVTYLLFKETQKSTKAATESAKAAIESAVAAQNTYNEQRFNDSVMRYRATADA